VQGHHILSTDGDALRAARMAVECLFLDEPSILALKKRSSLKIVWDGAHFIYRQLNIFFKIPFASYE